VISVIAQFISNEEVDHHCGSHGNRQSGNVDEGRELVSEDRAYGHFEVIFDHWKAGLLIGKLQFCDFVTQRPYILQNDAWNRNFRLFEKAVFSFVK
jgi:hypothetical protein